MATKQKAAAKPAAKQAPQAAAPETEEVSLEVGQQAKFLGYDENTPEEERVLTEGETYEIVGFTEADGDDPGGDPIVKAPNPDFDKKKKEHPENNPKFIEVQVFAEELEVEAEAEAEPEEAAAPAAKKAPAKSAPAKAASAKSAPAKAAPAGKKVAAAKKTAKAEEPEAEPVDPDFVPDLESEDAEVLALVQGSEDLIVTAQELDANVATSEYQLGGVLYHIKKDKLFKDLAPEYAEKGGWEKFLTDYFNIEYRKAQWLLEIYVHFNQAGVADAAAKVAQIGWTKAKTIAKELTKEGANVDDLLSLAAENTVQDLVTAIRDSEHVGGTAGEKKKRLTLKFRYLEADAATVEQGLEAIKEQVGLKDIGEALLHVVTEWIAEHGGTATKASAPAQKAAAKSAPAKKAAPRRAAAAA